MPNVWYIQGTNPIWSVNTNWTANVNGGSHPTDPPWTTSDTISDQLFAGSTFTGNAVVNTPLGDYDSIGIAPINGECLINRVNFCERVNGGRFYGGTYTLNSGAKVSNVTFELGTVNVTNGTVIAGDILNCNVSVGVSGWLGEVNASNMNLYNGPRISGAHTLINSGNIAWAEVLPGPWDEIGQEDWQYFTSGYNYGTIWDIDFRGIYFFCDSSGSVGGGRFPRALIDNLGTLYSIDTYQINNSGRVSYSRADIIYQFSGLAQSPRVVSLYLYGGTGIGVQSSQMTISGGVLTDDDGANYAKNALYVQSGIASKVDCGGFVSVDGAFSELSGDGVYCKGNVSVTNSGCLNGGTYRSGVTVGENGVSMGRISGGTFLGTLTVNSSDSIVASGQFLGTAISNRGTIQHDLTIWGNPTYTRLGTGVCLARRPCDVVGSF